MATNTIELIFEPCEPFPDNGVLVRYRPLGSGGEYRTVMPNPTESPIIIVDTNDPLGTSYEGTIQGDCGNGKFGEEVPWEAINDESGSQSASGGEPPESPCKTFVLSAISGTPVANYTDCLGIAFNKPITTNTTICTNGEGYIISGGTVTVESETEGPCFEEWDYYLADEYACDDCGGAPIEENLLIRIPAGTTIHVGKFYRPLAHPTGAVYQIHPAPQFPASSILMSINNFTTCAGACAGE